MKDTPNKGHLSIEDTVCCPNQHRVVYNSTSDSELGTPLYTGQPAGSQWCPLQRGATVYRTASWVQMVSSIERFHCIQDNQLGPNDVLYRELPLYTGQPAGSQWCPLQRGATVYRTASWVPMVSCIERCHCISYTILPIQYALV